MEILRKKSPKLSNRKGRICTFMEAQFSFRRSSSMIWLMRSGWMIFPITLGSGKRLFADGLSPAAFKMTESTVTSKGVILVTNVRAQSQPEAYKHSRRVGLKNWSSCRSSPVPGDYIRTSAQDSAVCPQQEEENNEIHLFGIPRARKIRTDDR